MGAPRPAPRNEDWRWWGVELSLGQTGRSRLGLCCSTGVMMRREKPLEQAILDRFFKKLAESEDFSAAALERLLQLRREDSLRNTDKVLQALKDGEKPNA
jgi:hypothetical protein